MNYLIVVCVLYIIVIFSATRVASSSQSSSFPLITIVLAFGFIVGLRWMVGNDYESYFMCLTTEIGIDRFELIPRNTIHLFYTLGIPFFYWFMLFSVIQITLYILGYLKDFKFALPFGLFFFFSYELAFFTSGVRQATALCLVFYAYSFITERKLVPYLILMVLAFLNHKSAIIGLPVYWFVGNMKPLKVPQQIVIFTLCTFVGRLIINTVLSNTIDLFNDIGYEAQAERVLNGENAIVIGSGFGIVFYYFVYVYIMIISPKILKTYQDTNLNVYYNIFFISVCVYMATMDNQYLSRAMKYYTIVTPLVLACSVHYLMHSGRIIISYGIIVCYIALTVFTSYDKTWDFIFLH